MDKELVNQLCADYNQADMILIGIGSELKGSHLNQDFDKVILYYKELLEKKNYFIITSNTDRSIEKFDFNRKRFVQPMLVANTVDDISEEVISEEKKQWDLYNKWLSATLNKSLLIIELGEGFSNPNLFRWPFEKVTLINNKAKLYRINNTFSQIPQEIAGKAISINVNSAEFLSEVSNIQE